MKLSELSVPKGARHRKKRVGHGEGSGLGKTCGRGGKGQTARAGGKIRAGFEGGQMPLYRRLPKVGFRSQKKVLGINVYDVINLDLLNAFEDGATVTSCALYARGYGRKASSQAGIKILGTGELKKRLTVKVEAASESAKKAIQAAGGSIEIIGGCRGTCDAADKPAS